MRGLGLVQAQRMTGRSRKADGLGWRSTVSFAGPSGHSLQMQFQRLFHRGSSSEEK